MRWGSTGLAAVALLLGGCFASLVTGEPEGDPAAPAEDMGTPREDALAPPDAFSPPDAGPLDLSSPDIGLPTDAGPVDAGPVDAGPMDAGPPPFDGGPAPEPDLARCDDTFCLLLVAPASGSDDVFRSTAVDLIFNRGIDSQSGTVTLVAEGEEIVLRGDELTTFALIARDIGVFHPDFLPEFGDALEPGWGTVHGVRLRLPSPLPAGAVVRLQVNDDWETGEMAIRFDPTGDPLARGVFRVRE